MNYQHEQRIGRTVSIEVAKRSCLDKKKWRSRNKARDKAAAVKRETGAIQRPYHCTLCGGWHLATVRPKQEQRKRA